MTRRDTEESAFQCSDDVYDMKILHDAIVCGLRNGTVEIWNRKTLKREFSLEDQNGSVQVSKVAKDSLRNFGSFSCVNFLLSFLQVDANDQIVVGVSSDSTVCVWDRLTGTLKGFYPIYWVYLLSFVYIVYCTYVTWTTKGIP